MTDIRERVAEVLVESGYLSPSKKHRHSYELAGLLLEAFPQLAEEQWEYGIYDPSTNYVEAVGDGPVTKADFTGIKWEMTGEHIVRRRRAGEWEEVK